MNTASSALTSLLLRNSEQTLFSFLVKSLSLHYTLMGLLPQLAHRSLALCYVTWDVHYHALRYVSRTSKQQDLARTSAKEAPGDGDILCQTSRHTLLVTQW